LRITSFRRRIPWKATTTGAKMALGLQETFEKGGWVSGKPTHPELEQFLRALCARPQRQ